MTTTAGTSAVQSATKSLLTSLGTGSGVDTAGLVTSLVEAQFAARTAQLNATAEKLTAQISGVSTIRSNLTGFANALDSLAKGGTLQTQPKSSAAAVATATSTGSGVAPTLASTIRVDRLATAQGTASAKVVAGGTAATRSTVIGSGSFTLQLGTATYATADGTTTMSDFAPAGGAGTAVTFNLTDATVDTVAAAINREAKSLGITASVVTGANGEAFLSLKGATGTASAFTLATSGDAGLQQFDIGEGSAVTTRAQNAQLTVDGVAVERATNSVADLVAGVKLELTGVGSTNLSAARPADALAQAVEDVVATYNEVLAAVEAQTNAKTGKLFGDPAAMGLVTRLKTLTLSVIDPAAADGPKTLAELGVRTARDGTLSVDKAQLSQVIAAQPDAVERMFRSSTASANGLAGRLQAIATSAGGLGAATERYTRAQVEVADARDKLSREGEAMTTRLTQQFSAMNARVSAYKSVQTFLTNQIAAWNKSD